MTTQSSENAAAAGIPQDDRAPAQYASQAQAGPVHRAAFWVADHVTGAGVATAFVAGSFARGFGRAVCAVAREANPFHHFAQAKEHKKALDGMRVARALTMLGIPVAEYQFLKYAEARAAEWEAARKTLATVDGVDIGAMPQEWPLVRAIQDKAPWLKDLNRELGGDAGPVFAPADDVVDVETVPVQSDTPADVQAEADRIAADLIRQGYSAGESKAADGSPSVFTDAPPQAIAEAVKVAERVPNQYAGDIVAQHAGPIAETTGQAALREIGPEAAVQAVGEIAREMHAPVIVADTPDGGASIAPLTPEGIAATARAMADSAGIVSGIVVDETRVKPQTAGDVSLAALTAAAGAFTLRPTAETAAAWRKAAKLANKAGLIDPQEVVRTKVQTADYIPHTGQGPLRGSSKRKY